MRIGWRPLVLVVIALCVSRAWAGPGIFDSGTGRDGALLVTEPGRIINRYTQATAPLATGDTSVFVSSTEGIAAGDLVMVLQTTGIVPEPRRGDPGPIDLKADPVGRWELVRVELASGTELRLTTPLEYAYAGLVTQVIRVPEYTDVTVEAGASLVAEPWNGSTGGVLAFLVKGTLRNEGELNVTGAGFRAGVAPPETVDVLGCAMLPVFMREGASRGEGIAVLGYGPLERGMENASNGGGGGGCPLAGGGGGGNGAAGGRGGDALAPWDGARDIGGRGGSALEYSLMDHLSLGGGGGQGHGETGSSRAGAGGGGILVQGQRLAGKGFIVADGEEGQTAILGGASGGGAGGSVYLRFAEGAECGEVSAQGGKGGASSARALAYSGPGGGGGGGRVLFHAEGPEFCPISVEAGLAGEGTSTQGIGETGSGAGPTASQLTTHRGVVNRLARGTTMLACSFNVPMEPTFESPVDLEAISDATPEVRVSILDTGGYIVTISMDEAAPESATEIPAGSKKWFYTPTVPLQPGTRTIEAKVTCGNRSMTKTISVWVDFTPPQTVFTGTLPVNPTSAKTAKFDFEAQNEQRAVYFKCQLDQDPIADCSPSSPSSRQSTISYTNLADGLHVFKVYAIDTAGNQDTTPAAHSWVVDTVAPNTAIDDASKPLSLTKATSGKFTYTSTESVSQFFCRLDTPTFAQCDATGYPFGPLGDGAHTFCVYAKDPAGNKDDQSPACHNWTVDTTKPNTRITKQPTNPSNATSAIFEFTADDPGVTYKCSLDTAAFTACSSPTAYTNLSAGPHTFRVYAIDAAGNEEGELEAASYPWTIDLSVPDTTMPKKPPALTNNPNAEFEFGSDKSGVSYRCSLDNAIYVQCSSPVTFSNLSDGSHRLCAVARDAAGNEDLSPVCHAWTVDTQKPVSTIVKGPPDPTNEVTAVFEFKANESAATFECSLDNQQFALCTSSKSETVAAGVHNFRVRAKDVAGNLEDAASAAVHTWTVDLTPPNAPIIANPSEGLVTNATTSLIVDGTAEARSVVNVFINGGRQIAGTAVTDTAGKWFLTVSIAGLGDGEHTLTADAKDVAGNTGVVSSGRKFILDRIPPETFIIEKPPVLSNSRNASFKFGSDAPVKGYRCNLLDGRGWFDCPNGLALVNLPDGAHTLDVAAVDFGENEDPTPERYQWTVDTIPPDVRVTSPKDGEEVGSNTPEIVGLAERATVIRVFIDNPSSPIGQVNTGANGEWIFRVTSPLSNGPHTLIVEATEPAGNKGSFGPVSFVIDTEPPETEIFSKPAKDHILQESAFVFKSPSGATVFQCSLDPEQLDTPTFEHCEAVYKVVLEDGPHRLLVRAVDNAGNMDPTPEKYEWRVAVDPPEVPTITYPEDGADVYSLTPTISGITVPEGEISLYIDGKRLSGSALADGDGKWAYTLSAPLDEGSHELDGMVKNPIGNLSKRSTPRTFIAYQARAQAKATGGGLGCTASGSQPGLALLALIAGAVWNSRRRRR
jgi:hypothetical protein